MSTYKRGSTLQILLEFTQEEWDAIYPHEEFLAECEITGGVEYELTPTFNIPERTILLRSPTDGWTRGRYKCDVKIVKNGITSYIPPNSYIEFEIIAPVTETETANEVST